MEHCLGAGSTALVPYRGALSFEAAVLNPRWLPERSFGFVSHRGSSIEVAIEQQWGERCGVADQRQADGTGTVVWDAALVLCDLLCARPHLVAGHTVVELGAGTGIVAIVASQLGAAAVHATDLDHALLLLARNCWLNGVGVGWPGRKGCGVSTSRCRWGDASDAHSLRRLCGRGGVGVILGSDLIYKQDRSTFQALLRTIRELSDAQTRVLLLSMFRMNPEDAEFVRLARSQGFTVDMEPVQATRKAMTGSFQLIRLGVPEPQESQERR